MLSLGKVTRIVAPAAALLVIAAFQNCQLIRERSPASNSGSSAPQHSAGAQSYAISSKSGSSMAQEERNEKTNVSFHGHMFRSRTVVSSDAGIRPGYGYHLGYMYAPSIVKFDGKYHLFGCSADWGQATPNPEPHGWDQIRYSTSDDGENWTEPKILLYATDMVGERSACDPSVVQFNGYWYLFYSGNEFNTGTTNFVARSRNIHGPYEKWVGGDRWEIEARNPQPILRPRARIPEEIGTLWYGAGQQAVVAKDGALYNWYSDDTLGFPNIRAAAAMFTRSTDGIHWSPAVPVTEAGTNQRVEAGSFEVKYQPEANRFMMIYIENAHLANTRLLRRYSSDGLVWSAAEVVIDADRFPKYSHNVGVSGDASGWDRGEPMIVAYGTSHFDDPREWFTRESPELTAPSANWDTVWHALPGTKSRAPTKILGRIEDVRISSSTHMTISGWACASGASDPISIDLYVDGPAGVGRSFVRTIADQPGDAVLSAICGSNSVNHRFTYRLDRNDVASFIGKGIFVHGLSPDGQSNLLLTDSGKFRFPSGGVKGWLDRIDLEGGRARISGWTCAEGSARSIQVHVYVGNNGTPERGIAIATADVSNEPAVDAECKTNGVPHRYSILLDPVTTGSAAGKQVFAYGVPLNGESSPSLLEGSVRLKVPHP